MTERVEEIIEEKDYNIDIKDLFNHDMIQLLLKKSTEKVISDNEELLKSLTDNTVECIDKSLVEMYNTVFNKEEENVY